MGKEVYIYLFNYLIVRVKQSIVFIGLICSVVALHLNLLHAPEWLKDTISLISFIYLGLARPAAYKEKNKNEDVP
jgi:hypothetical protein